MEGNVPVFQEKIFSGAKAALTTKPVEQPMCQCARFEALESWVCMKTSYFRPEIIFERDYL